MEWSSPITAALTMHVVSVSRLQQERVALLQELHQVRSALRDKDSRAEAEAEAEAEESVSVQRGDAKSSKSRPNRARQPDATANYRREKSLVMDLNKEVRVSTRPAAPCECPCSSSSCVCRAGGEPAQRAAAGRPAAVQSTCRERVTDLLLLLLPDRRP